MVGKKNSASIVKYFLNALSIIPKIKRGTEENLVSTKLRLIEFGADVQPPND